MFPFQPENLLGNPFGRAVYTGVGRAFEPVEQGVIERFIVRVKPMVEKVSLDMLDRILNFAFAFRVSRPAQANLKSASLTELLEGVSLDDVSRVFAHAHDAVLVKIPPKAVALLIDLISTANENRSRPQISLPRPQDENS